MNECLHKWSIVDFNDMNRKEGFIFFGVFSQTTLLSNQMEVSWILLLSNSRWLCWTEGFGPPVGTILMGNQIIIFFFFLNPYSKEHRIAYMSMACMYCYVHDSPMVLWHVDATVVASVDWRYACVRLNYPNMQMTPVVGKHGNTTQPNRISLYSIF